jgi:uridylate kinase
VNINIGRLLATCTNATALGSALRFVIIQPEAVSDIAMPVRAKVLANQITAHGR